MRLALLGSLLFICMNIAPAIAQRQTTIQLPTIRTFGVQTTVSVPDRGTTHLGGVTRGWAGSQSRGVPGLGRLPGVGRPFQQRAFGAGMAATNSSVSAQIIDLQAMDEALLSEARGQHTPPTFWQQHMGRGMAAQPNPQVAPRPLPEPPMPVRSSDATTQQLLDLGDAALEKGDYRQATAYYAAAERRAQQR
ncbi:MAG: hypothetical protein AAGF97_01345 [Planctomycetota bacterium]